MSEHGMTDAEIDAKVDEVIEALVGVVDDREAGRIVEESGLPERTQDELIDEWRTRMDREREVI